MEPELAEISKNYFLITSLIAPVSSLSFRTIRRTSRGAQGLTALQHARTYTHTAHAHSHTHWEEKRSNLGEPYFNYFYNPPKHSSPHVTYPLIVEQAPCQRQETIRLHAAVSCLHTSPPFSFCLLLITLMCQLLNRQPFLGLTGANYCMSFNEWTVPICPCLNTISLSIGLVLQSLGPNKFE